MSRTSSSNLTCYSCLVFLFWQIMYKFISKLQFSGLTAYGYAFYCILGRDERGHGSPLAYIITSSDTSYVLRTCLETLIETAETNNFLFQPRYVL